MLTHSKVIITAMTGFFDLRLFNDDAVEGHPFIFKEVNDYMESAILPKEICPKLKIDTAISHYKLALKYKTQHKAVTEMRKHLGWYLKGLKNSARIKDHINKMYEPSDVINALTEYAQSLT